MVPDLLTKVQTALGDRYRLEQEVGAGGMATVYLAQDLRHDRKVAVKVLRPELAAVIGAERFLTEIKTTARLQHPHILPLFDSGEAQGFLYYVMPLVEGESLGQRLQREGQLPLDEALRLTWEIAEALDYAHGQGIIHRDIKPENLLLSRNHVLVADFGIALAITQAGGGRLTETGLSLGTPAYMSPEQAMAETRLDHRTDQYSLACVLYEMLAGEPPYTGPTAQAVIAKRLSEPVPHIGTLRQVPASVEVAVTRALAKAPADRFQTINQFAAALARPRVQPRRTLSHGALAVVGGITLVLLIGVVAWVIGRSRPPEAMVTRQLSFTGTACCPALSPDGKWAAFVRSDSMMVQDLSGRRSIFVARATLTSDDPRWSPDATRLLYTTRDSQGTGLYAVPRLGGDPHRIATAGWAFQFSYSPDGRQVVFSQGITDSIFVADVTSGSVVRRISVAPKSYMAWRVRYSPDGRWIAFGGEKEGVPFLAVVSQDGAIVHRLVDWVDRGTVEWSPRGDAIYFFQRVPGGADLMKVPFDKRTGTRRGPQVRVISHAPFYEFSIAADGRTLLFEKLSRVRHVWTMTIAGGHGREPKVEAKPLTSGTATFGNPAISPDGRLVAYAQDDVTERNIYVVPFEGGTPRLIGPTRTDRVAPGWAPDNRRVAFASADSASGGIMIADIRGPRLSRLGRSPIRLLVASLVWSPDSKKLLYPSDDPTRFVMLDLDTNQESSFSPPKPTGMLYNPHFSPNGEEIILGASNGYTQVFWHVDVPTGRWKPLSGPAWNGVPLRWAPDGWIYLMRGKNIWRLRPSGQQAQLYASLPEECRFLWEQPTLDDRADRMVCTVGKDESDVWMATGFDSQE